MAVSRLPASFIPCPRRSDRFTRASRVHHRLTWQQRLSRNALTPEHLHWQVEMHGISAQLAAVLHQSEQQSG